LRIGNQHAPESAKPIRIPHSAISMSAVTTSASTIGSFTREAFEAHLQSVSHLPAWWLDRKRAAYDRFASLPMPVRTDEFWRFSNLSRVTLDGFALAAPVDFKEIIHESVGVAGAGHLVLANGRLVASEPL
jgi:Fe-S cluster assembly protein SufD